MRARDRRERPPITIEAIGAELLRLCRHVDALEKSATRLAGRIDPVDDEKEPSSGAWFAAGERLKGPPATLDAVFAIIQQVDTRVRCIEYDFNAIRSNIDQISNDSWSRVDLKKYLDKKDQR
jgi:hypothetical protein